MATSQTTHDPSLWRLLVGDGRPLIAVAGLLLLFAGIFALFVASREEFLPHDVAFLGMNAPDLCAVHGCRVVHFMVHDRVAFGGVLIAIGLQYLWLNAGPLRNGEHWAWELLFASGGIGFASFLAYLGYGYLDTWHGAATVILAPVFVSGLIVTRVRTKWSIENKSWLARPAWLTYWRDQHSMGRLLLLVTAGGMICGGLTIVIVGMTCVFVPQDVAYIGANWAELEALNPRLLPLIAHDRAGFGGAVCCGGVVMAGVAWRSRLDRAARQVLGLAGLVGFGCAILVHPAIGYNDLWHLMPAISGAIIFVVGMCLVRSRNPC
jgi:hypothetical protein